MADYKTLQHKSTAEFRDRGSRFIACARPVQSEAEAKDYIDDIRAEHHKARHVCYAYKVELDPVITRANDDGEPSNTAGQPILNYINKYNLDNIVVAVVRYFGGVLLGKGGLINAYGTAAENAILNGKIIRAKEYENIDFEFDFSRYATVMELIKEYRAEIKDESYGDKCLLKIRIEKDSKEAFLKATAEDQS